MVEVVASIILLIFLFLFVYFLTGIASKTKTIELEVDEMLYDIQVKYHSKDIDKIQKIENGDWIDLRASKDYELKKGEFALVDLGVSIKIPDCCEAHLAPRSSTFKNFKVIQTNGVGVIDSSYCGEEDVWRMPVIAMEKTKIAKNERVCQFRIMEKMPPVRIVEVESMQDESRGGFGSTGTK
jgi:dUTP pyrophosphatase